MVKPTEKSPNRTDREDDPRVARAAADPLDDPLAQQQRPRDDGDLVGARRVDRQLVDVAVVEVPGTGARIRDSRVGPRPAYRRGRARAGWGGGLIAAAGEHRVQHAAPAGRARSAVDGRH